MFEKNKQVEVPGIIPAEETVDLEVDVNTLEEPTDAVEAQEPIQQPIPQQVQSIPKAKIQEARIIAGELLESGIYKYTLLATKEIGKIGETFEI